VQPATAGPGIPGLSLAFEVTALFNSRGEGTIGGKAGMTRGRISIGAVIAVVALVLLLPAGSIAGSPVGKPAIDGLERCALGKVPGYLRDHLTGAISAEQHRFVSSLTGIGVGRRERAARDFAIGTAAYIYGMPTALLRDTVAKYPANALIGLGRLATPDSQGVVAPNHDTLYSVSRVELGAGPMVIDAPDTAGRYSVLQLMDANTNSISYIGSGDDRDHAGATLLTPPGWSGEVPHGVDAVESPTNIVWLLGRTLIDDGDADRAAAQDLMRQYALTPLDDWKLGIRRHESVVDKAPNSPRTPIAPGLQLFDEIGAALAADPPRSENCALKQFAKVGIAAGETPSSSAAGVRRDALGAAREAGERIVDDAVDFRAAWSRRRNHGWQVSPGDTARFGRDYVQRAMVATVGLAANTRRTAFYPKTDRDSKGRKLRGKHDYRISFAPGELPPVRAFWSLTVYNESLFLVPNPIDRYAIGDRTAGLHYGGDGSLKLYLTHEDPGGARSANWLPTPAGRFLLHLRLYEPGRAAFNGEWDLPTIKRTK
jgi:hypothetical protein